MASYDLEERTLKFAVDVRLWVKKIPRTIANTEDGKQVIRSSGSIGANYIEANEKLSDKDFLFRVKISRKEAKETIYWLKIIHSTNVLQENIKQENLRLIQEAKELKMILSSIINKRRLS